MNGELERTKTSDYYQGFQLTLLADWRVAVHDIRNGGVVNADTHLTTAQSRMSAIQAIDEHLKKEAARARQKWGKFKVLTDDGEDNVVKGVNKKDASLLFETSTNSYYVFPVHPAIQRRLRRIKELQQEAGNLTNEISKFSERAQAGWRGEVETQAKQYTRIQDALADKLVLANQQYGEAK